MIREGGADAKARIERGFQLALARAPREREVPVLDRTCCEHALRPVPGRSGRRPGPCWPRGSRRLPPDIDPVELAAWTSVARVLLNLQETISRS